MKVEIVVVYHDRYRGGHEKAFVPPLTGLHLAALVPPGIDVSLRHEKLRPVDFASPPDADLFLLTFGTGFAPRAYALADALRAMGRTVVAGGPHATVWPEEAGGHVDSVVVGEAESVMTRLIADAEAGRLEKVYRGDPLPLYGLPAPRYDLLEPGYFVGRVVMATRGCPFGCSFCSTPRLTPGWRARPVHEVIRDIESYEGHSWHQRKIAWFWDDNLTADRGYAKELLRAMVPLRKWWVTQTSLDCTHDDELLGLMEASGCIGVFLGIESVDANNLRSVRKALGVPSKQIEAIRKLHERGIAVMAGFLVGFDSESPQDVVEIADRMKEIGIDVPFISVLTPFGETPLRERLEEEGSLLADRGWEFYNGYNVTYRPRLMSPRELEGAHRKLWARAFAPSRALGRVVHGARDLRAGAFALSALMNGYYGLKHVRDTGPRLPSTSGFANLHPAAG